MRMPRFTVRGLVVSVAVTGLMLGIWSWMARRSVAFDALAAAHAERAFRISLACRIDSRRLFYHEALAAKYKRAASQPWLPVEPDPPNPRD